MALRKLTMIRGDSQTYNLVFNQASGLPYCLKNWVVFFTLKTNVDLPDSQATLQKIVTAFPDTTSGTSGSATISLTPADTINLDPLIYDFDIAVRTATNDTYTVMKGKFNLEYDVTKTAGTAGTAP